jgi:hypothetical protein
LAALAPAKHFSAKGMVEADLAAGERVCVVDPTGAWWGLRLKPDGETPAYPVVIFGGDHADIRPTKPDAGRARVAKYPAREEIFERSCN